MVRIAPAQQSHATDSQVKAAYLYNFGKFVTWTGANAGSEGSFEICVLGKDPFGVVLDSTVAGGNIADKQVTAKKISSLTGIGPLPHCVYQFVGTGAIETYTRGGEGGRDINRQRYPSFCR